MDFTDQTIRQLNTGLVQKKFSSQELVDFYLDRISKYNEKLNVFLTVTDEQAKRQALKTDETLRQAQGDNLNLLSGIPAGIKDVIVTKSVRSTGGSKILENYVPPFNATVINKLDEAGYVLLGKQNCDEFAQGASTEHSGYGPTKNPWDLSRVPGGSSGGSAAAVAAGLCHYALGTDTGGSVRQPASLCGVVGFKSTYGRISRYGIMAMASSLDQVGIFARRVSDVKDVLEVIEGEDALDATSSQNYAENSAELRGKNLKGVRVGVPKEYFVEGLDKQVEQIIKKSIDQLAKLGAEIKEISLPHSKYAIATYYIIVPAEVSSNMARYDSIRYGVSKQKTEDGRRITDLIELYQKNRSEFLGEEVKRRIMLGTYVLSAGYYDAYYGKAQLVRQLIIEDFRKAFAEVDVIAGPTAPTPAFKIGEKSDDPLAMYLSDVYTSPVNLAGLPGISVPAGFAEIDNKKLPVGLHLISKWWDDDRLLGIAEQFEQANEYYKEKPSL